MRKSERARRKSTEHFLPHSSLQILPSGCQFVTTVGATQGFSPEVAAGLDIADYYSGAGVSNTFKTPSFQKAALSKYLASPANNAPKDAYNTTGKGYPGKSLNYLMIQDWL